MEKMNIMTFIMEKKKKDRVRRVRKKRVRETSS